MNANDKCQIRDVGLMKLLYLSPLLLIFLIPQAFASNSLENEQLFADSGTVSLDIKFGEDDIRYGLTRNFVTNSLEDITLKFYGDEIPLEDPKVKISSSGEHFRISSIPDGVMIYGHQNESLDNYKIKVYFAGLDGLVGFSVSTAASLQDDKTTKTDTPTIKEKYIPDLKIITDIDYTTYWNDYFNMSLVAYDLNHNDRPDIRPFEGTIDDVEVSAIVSFEGEEITTLQGLTKYGEWKGEHYFVENISKPGEYTVDIIASFEGATASETASMFVIGTVQEGGSTNPDTDGDGIPDNHDNCPVMLEDGVDNPATINTDESVDGCPI